MSITTVDSGFPGLPPLYASLPPRVRERQSTFDELTLLHEMGMTLEIPLTSSPGGKPRLRVFLDWKPGAEYNPGKTRRLSEMLEPEDALELARTLLPEDVRDDIAENAVALNHLRHWGVIREYAPDSGMPTRYSVVKAPEELPVPSGTTLPLKTCETASQAIDEARHAVLQAEGNTLPKRSLDRILTKYPKK